MRKLAGILSLFMLIVPTATADDEDVDVATGISDEFVIKMVKRSPVHLEISAKGEVTFHLQDKVIVRMTPDGGIYLHGDYVAEDPAIEAWSKEWRERIW